MTKALMYKCYNEISFKRKRPRRHTVVQLLRISPLFFNYIIILFNSTVDFTVLYTHLFISEVNLKRFGLKAKSINALCNSKSAGLRELPTAD